MAAYAIYQGEVFDQERYDQERYDQYKLACTRSTGWREGSSGDHWLSWDGATGWAMRRG
jgi:hypothetical protein